jgi:hypothetical protein
MCFFHECISALVLTKLNHNNLRLESHIISYVDIEFYIKMTSILHFLDNENGSTNGSFLFKLNSNIPNEVQMSTIELNTTLLR